MLTKEERDRIGIRVNWDRKPIGLCDTRRLLNDIDELLTEVRQLNAKIAVLRYDADHNARR